VFLSGKIFKKITVIRHLREEIMECDQSILLLHKYPVKINKINNLSEKFLAPIIRWDVKNLLPSAELEDIRWRSI